MNLTEFKQKLFRAELDENEVLCVSQWTKHKGFRAFPLHDKNVGKIEKGIPRSVYGCVASFHCEQGNLLFRRKDSVCRYHCVMLDDIGTKVAQPPIEPTFILETSPHNYQWLLRLSEPETDMSKYVSVLKALTGDYGDAGARSATQLFRLPGSINQKTDPDKKGFVTRVVDYSDVSYTLDEIVAILGLDVTPEKNVPVLDTNLEPSDDTLFSWLLVNDLVISDSERGGFFTIVCPWNEKHTDGNEEACYSPIGFGKYRLLRGFNCFHGHCVDKKTHHFIKWALQQGCPELETSTTLPASALGEIDRNTVSPDELLMHLEQSLPYIDKAQLPDVLYKKDGEFSAVQLPTTENVRNAVKQLGLRVRRNMEEHREVILPREGSALSAVLPQDSSEASDSLSTKIHDRLMKVSIRGRDIDLRIEEISKWDKYSPVCEWVDSKPWDCVSRFQKVVDTIQTPDEKLWPVYLRRWSLQAIQAWHNWEHDPLFPYPIENILVFAGPQEAYKTRWLEALVGPRFFTRGARLMLGFSAAQDRDSIRKATSRPVTELGELETTFKKTSQGALKAFMSDKMDTYRAAYAKTEVTYPRTTVFVATVNRTAFLMDTTGNRRFWPIHVSKANPEHGIDMQQYWAEMKAYWIRGEKWFLSDDEISAREENSHRFRSDHLMFSLVDEFFQEYTEEPQKMTATAVMAMIRNSDLGFEAFTMNNENRHQCVEAMTHFFGEADRKRKWLVPTARKEKPFA